VLIVDKRITFALALRGRTLEMLEELQETLKCCNHAQALEKAIRIAWEVTQLPTEKEYTEKPPDKLILCVADNCDQPVMTGRYHCREHLPEGPPAH